MLYVKSSVPVGCTYLGKGFVGHPEMGVVVDRREVLFDDWDVMRAEWTGKREETHMLIRTDNGFVLDEADIFERHFYEIEDYAPNWRARKYDAWDCMF